MDKVRIDGLVGAGPVEWVGRVFLAGRMALTKALGGDEGVD